MQVYIFCFLALLIVNCIDLTQSPTWMIKPSNFHHNIILQIPQATLNFMNLSKMLCQKRTSKYTLWIQPLLIWMRLIHLFIIEDFKIYYPLQLSTLHWPAKFKCQLRQKTKVVFFLLMVVGRRLSLINRDYSWGEEEA